MTDYFHTHIQYMKLNATQVFNAQHNAENSQQICQLAVHK